MVGIIDIHFLYDAFDNVELVTSNNDFFSFIESEKGIKFRFDTRTKSEQDVNKANCQRYTHVSRATRSASTPTGQCITAVTCPSTSIPRELVS